ncbi:MAG: hypothetical protein AB7U05_17235 [Mangrovibacterium sp.]
MESLTLNNYFEKNYKKLLDYANFHADKNGLTGMGEDILSFVLEIVLANMDRNRVLRLLQSKYGNYNELHTYIMGMIKINAYSSRSDFRRKILSNAKLDYSVNVGRLKIMDVTHDPEQDLAGDIFARIQRVRNELEALEVSDLEKDVFKFKFFYGHNLSEWDGPEPKSKVYKIYNRVIDILKDRIVPNQLQLS